MDQKKSTNKDGYLRQKIVAKKEKYGNGVVSFLMIEEGKIGKVGGYGWWNNGGFLGRGKKMVRWVFGGRKVREK